ncbi:DNA polymerase III subunit gamma/tau [Patescibacteria group bacterium]|nr:DNA polymerase III subunit gamma/tau [Patescibacteria group bacterium]
MSNNLVLYRKYRPQSFSEIIGQEHIVKTLTNALKLDKVAHAYLFTGPRGTGKCVKYDTNIVDSRTGQILTAKDVYEQRKINLFTLSKDYKLKHTKPIDYIDDGIKPCYKVTTALGKEIEVTLSHPFLTIKGWKKLSELQINDRIGIPRVLPINGTRNMPENHIKLVAHLITEGSIYDLKGSIGFTNSDPILADDFILAVKKFENIKVVKYDSHGTRIPTYRATQIVRQNWINKPGESKNSVKKFAKELGLVGQKSKDKTIPKIIFQLDRSLIGLFLKTLYSGDGGVDFTSTPTISYYSASKKLIDQVQHLLLRFGIIARIRYKPVVYNGNICPNWALDISHRESISVFANEIGFIGEKAEKLQSMITFLSNRSTNSNYDTIPVEIYDLVRSEKELVGKTWNEVGLALNYKRPKNAVPCIHAPSRDKLRIYGEVFNSQKVCNVANSDIYWDRIVNIEYIGKHQVYDLTIPETHNFVANDFIVHNTTMARLLAKAVNCEKRKNSEPCNKCLVCQEISQGKSLDLIEIDAASNRGIDEIRELRDGIKFIPNQLKYKVFVIDECHQLTGPAFNALLKTLEEPPTHAIFILATTEIHKVPQTIISRCQKFDFHKLTLDKIVQRLNWIAEQEKVNIEKPALELIALNADGSIRDGESLLGQIISLEDKKITLEEVQTILGVTDIKAVQSLVQYLTEKNNSKAISHINQVAGQGYDLIQFTKSLISYLRKMLILKIDPDLVKLVASELTKEQIDVIIEQGNKFSQEDLIKTIHFFIKAGNEIKRSDFPQLPLELAIVECCE